MKKPAGLEYIPMLISICLWSGTYIAGKFAVSELNTLNLMTLRYLGAAFLMSPFLIKGLKESRPDIKDHILLLITGLTGMFGNNIFFFMAIRYTSVMNASIIFAITPLLTAIMAWLILKEPLTLKRLGAIAVALFGVILLITGGNLSTLKDMTFNIGDLYELGAAMCAAIFTVTATKVTHYRPTMVISYGMTVAAILSIATLWGTGYFSMDEIKNLSPLAWKSVAYLVILASCVAYMMQQISIKLIGPNRTAAFVNLSPAMTIAMAAYFLGESISFLQCVSASIIIMGVAMNASTKKDQSQKGLPILQKVRERRADV